MPGISQRPQINWSYLKSKYAGELEEDAEVHLLRTNDCIDIHDFQYHEKVQQFCSTLIGEGRLWYKSLRPINADWEELQHMFRQQYTRIGYTREQIFHAWRLFHFDENTETIDAYIHCIRQVANLLGYQDPQVLEVFKNTPSVKIILGTFPHRRVKCSSRHG